jgi:hypothetical protein
MLTYADVHRKKAEETKNELDLSSLVQAAALKEKELKEAEIASKQQRQAAQQVSASNGRASAAAGAAEHAGAHAEHAGAHAEHAAAHVAAGKEGRWWEQVETDTRDIAAGVCVCVSAVVGAGRDRHT